MPTALLIVLHHPSDSVLHAVGIAESGSRISRNSGRLAFLCASNKFEGSDLLEARWHPCRRIGGDFLGDVNWIRKIHKRAFFIWYNNK